MYSRFGKIGAARHLFDEMPDRNKASWNTMISALVRAGMYPDAVNLFRDMRDAGNETNGFVIASVLTACSRADDMVHEGFQVHCLVMQIGLLDDVFVGTALLHFYGVYGIVSMSRRLFEEMPHRNVVSWTSLIVNYSDSGDPGEVMNIYKQMRREGVSCNPNTFTALISLHSSLGDELIGRQVLGHVIKSGLETEVSVGNSLVTMFGNFGHVQEACYVFDHMNKRDTISWNSMISAYAHNCLCEEALGCFYLMRRVYKYPDSTTLSTLLSVCGSVENLKWGRGIHGLVLKLGFHSDLCINNTLLTMYAEAGRYIDAEDLFQGMPERDLISWNSMMAGYVLEGKCLDALIVFSRLLQTRKTMNHVTFASALAACSTSGFVAEGKIVHALVFTAGLQDNRIVGNAIVTMYGKCGMMCYAKQVFQRMPEKESVTWNALIGGYAENEEPDQAIKLFMLMRKGGEPTNYITVVNVLGACSAPKELLKHGMPLHALIVLTGFESENYVKNSLITMYAKCGDLKSSNYLFNGLVNKNSVAWNAMVAANGHHGHWEETLRLFAEMQRVGVGFDQFSLSVALAASANLANLEEGQLLHSSAMKLGFASYLYVANAITDMYGKCGEIDDVLKMLPDPKVRPQLSWNILISAFARHGSFQKAREAFHEMVELGLKPNHVTFVSLLSACSHGGLVDDGLAYFASMTKDFGVPAGIEHCVCMVDLLGRSGRLSEAEAFIKEMPTPPNDFVWRSLLAACRIHGNLELGRKAAEHLLKSDPSDDSVYVLYSNVYATRGRWEDSQNVWREMKSNNIKKQPAWSWELIPPSCRAYVCKIRGSWEDNQRSIVFDTSFALHDADEEQKPEVPWTVISA
ncbi:hypothetical protein RJ640_005049 [Escallonia rubra]|uniref:Pentatricopeptide repeat-containing protein n=1 Tax=Escallonia rubra TaxID=112253 RepID=A0AA88U5K8_9ASTE|nr:hypothetical protein RJ640_005049 [Escallonia rubra]